MNKTESQQLIFSVTNKTADSQQLIWYGHVKTNGQQTLAKKI